jgi:hypothetical protein
VLATLRGHQRSNNRPGKTSQTPLEPPRPVCRPGRGEVSRSAAEVDCRLDQADAEPHFGVLSGLVNQGALVRDVAVLVDRLTRPPARAFDLLRHRGSQAPGARRGRPAGACLAPIGFTPWRGVRLRWSDVDLKAGTVTIAHNRVSVNGRAMDSEPKTDRSARVLPLTPALTVALRRAQAIQRPNAWRLDPTTGRASMSSAMRPGVPTTPTPCRTSGGRSAPTPECRRSG